MWQSPHQVEGDSQAKWEESVRYQKPPRPSEVLRQALKHRGTREAGLLSSSPEELAERSGDLDAIVLKALRKEPEGRYGSVVSMSDDVNRYLEGLPVLARPSTARY